MKRHGLMMAAFAFAAMGDIMPSDLGDSIIPKYSSGGGYYSRKANLTKKQKKARAKNKRAKQSRRRNR